MHQINVTIGLLLSDASMDRNSKGKLNPSIRFGQSLQRKDLVLYYYNLMQPFVSGPPAYKTYKTQVKKDGTFAIGLVVTTLFNPVFQVFEELFYVNYSIIKLGSFWGRKCVKSKLLDYLNPESRAF